MMWRSVNTDITLDAGRYSVLVKVTAYRRKDTVPPEEVIRQNASIRREKLVQIGLSYDLAHTKGLVVETEEEKKEREEREERHRFTERLKLREETIKKLQKQWIRDKKMAARQRRRAEREAMVQEMAHPSCTEHHENHRVGSDDSGFGSGDAMGDSKRNGNGLPTMRKDRQSSRPPPPSLNLSFASTGYRDDREFLQDFEFDSDVDMPPEEPREPKNNIERTVSASPLGADPSSNEGMDGPWNAVCVVGLRVYSKDPQLRMQVVRPHPDESEAPLDRDDPAVSATQEKLLWLGVSDWKSR
jgi:hypothetical protein